MSKKNKEEWPLPKYCKDIKALVVKLVGIFLGMLGLSATLYPLVDQTKITHMYAAFITSVVISLLLLYIYLVYYEISNMDGKSIFKQTDSASIKKYMLHWIAYGGRVAIWTRDMSWANDESSKKLLAEKARNKELIICLPVHTSFSEELQKQGAEIYVYGTGLLSEPSARFTIAFYGRDGSKVAIGRAKSDKHIIEEFDTGSHPAFNLANELVQIAKNASQKFNGH
ncbi:hypothetical protein [Pantoea stewartii]|uniref:Uncharacterized protein n=1 Tax=Pantoea stewartii TaxID=66269 RepID=A0AB34VI08_9GAMM|nr:hypothetical protein [Pantoea stewartii]KTS73047.1 hypothetical protein RSA30_13560 [Pantoea stewartii]KTS99195.1 hypothetical protein RSA13_06205 [Pantoea stewartii]KTT09775.1 hypothetical protein RSA36_00085 [Pantoea stewartii]